MYYITAKNAEYKHNKKGKRACLCSTVDGDHAWFYDNNAVRLSISHLNIKAQRKDDLVAREFQSTREEYRTWKEWYPDAMTAPGCYDCSDINEVRSMYLAKNISPRVTYRGSEISALHIPLYKQHIYKNQDWQIRC